MDWLGFANTLADKLSGVYKITNLINNKVYIGVSSDLKYRLKTHYHKLQQGCHHNHHLQNSVNKYGLNTFTIQILELVEKNTLLIKEAYYQQLYKALDENFGYNILGTNTDGTIFHSIESKQKISKANSGRPKSEETKRKLSEINRNKAGYRHTEQHKQYMSNALKGRKLSEETRLKLSIAKRGRPSPLKGVPGRKASEAAKIKMSRSRSGELNPRAVKIIDRNGVVYSTIADVAAALSLCRTTISKMIKKGELRRI